MQLVYTMFISNNRPSFHMCWNENLVKHRKVPKYYENDCLQIFLLISMFLLTTNFVKKSHIYAGIFFTFSKGGLNQTWNAFNTTFLHQWKDWKSSYQVREAFTVFFQFNCSNFRLKQCQRLGFIKIVEEIKFEGFLDELESKKSF